MHIPRPYVVFPTKNLDLATAGAHPLDEPICFVRLATCLAHLGHDGIRVEPAVCPRGKFEVAFGIDVCLDTDKHMFFGVIEPMASTSSADDTLQLRRWAVSLRRDGEGESHT